MEWRCAWCGKPHELDDPPCDNCGHSKFEKAVERMPGTGEPQGSVWVCPDCGRQHQKHSPPCSRCGNLTLEQRDVSELDDPLAEIGTRWRDVAERKYVIAYVTVGILLVVLTLGATGVIDLPGFGEPSVPEAPGEAEMAGNLSLDGVEREFVFAVNERRQNASVAPLSADDSLERMAAYYNKEVVRSTYADGDGPDPSALDRFDLDCAGRPALIHDAVGDRGGSEPITAAGDSNTVTKELLAAMERDVGVDALLKPDEELIGVDVHVAPDDRVFVTVVVC